MGKLKEMDHLKNLGLDAMLILKWIYTQNRRSLIGFIRLRIRTSCGLLWAQLSNNHRMLTINCHISNICWKLKCSCRRVSLDGWSLLWGVQCVQSEQTSSRVCAPWCSSQSSMKRSLPPKIPKSLTVHLKM
jgi:hypothetical protein